MTLRTSLFTGLNLGFKTSMFTKWGGVITLADFDYREPAVQEFPTTAAGLATLVGDAAATPSYIWDCQETSGNLVDSIASEALVPDSSPLQGQEAIGLYDGTDAVSRKAVEFADGSAASFDGGTSLLDVTTGDMSVLVVFRMPDSKLGDLIGKVEAGVDGWRFYPNTSGRIALTMGDSLAVTLTHTHTMNSDYAGQWVCAIGHINGTADEARIFSSDGTAAAATDISTLGSMTNSDPLKLGEGRTTSLGGQVAYVAAFEGAASNALYALGQAAITNFWKHATDPSTVTALTTASRNSLISVPVAANRIAHFAAGTTPATTQLPIGYSAKLEAGAGGYGLYTNSAMTNLVPYSELSTSATDTNVTPTDNAVDSPDGFRSGTTLLATAAAGFQERVCVTVASTVYTASMYIKESTVGVAGRIVAYDLTGAAEIAAVAFTGTSDHVLKELTFTTPVGCISMGVRCEITTDTETVIATAWQLNLGTGRGAYIRTAGAAAALVASNYQGPAAGVAALGEISYSMVNTAYTTGTTIYFYTLVGTSTINRRHQYKDSATRIRMRIYDGLGSSDDLAFHNILTTGDLNDIRHVWDESTGGDNTGGKEQVLTHNGTTYNGAASPWDGTTGTGDETTTLAIGSAVGTSSYCDGIFARIRLFDGLSEVLP